MIKLKKKAIELIKLKKKAIELLDAVNSVSYSGKGLGYTIGRGLDAVLPFTCYMCYSYWFSCYFDQRGKLMKALLNWVLGKSALNVLEAKYECTRTLALKVLRMVVG
jgi:hypothetical protein